LRFSFTTSNARFDIIPSEARTAADRLRRFGLCSARRTVRRRSFLPSLSGAPRRRRRAKSKGRLWGALRPLGFARSLQTAKGGAGCGRSPSAIRRSLCAEVMTWRPIPFGMPSPGCEARRSAMATWGAFLSCKSLRAASLPYGMLRDPR